jgi:hypothetical protein
VTAGAGNDSFVDSPTLYGTDTGVGGSVRGNYCTLNPVVGAVYGGTYAGTFTNGNLDYAQSGNASHGFGTMAVPSTSSTGYYFEAVCTTMDTARTYIGLIDPLALPAISTNTASYGFPYKAIINNSGFYYNYASGTGGNSGYTTYTSYAQGDVIMVAYKNGTIWIGKNGTWMNSGNPAAGTGYLDNTIDTTKNWLPYVGYNSNFTINFGQRPFAYTAPSGFKALCTQNLPTPTIGATTATLATQYFTPTLFTGTGAAGNAVTVGFQPDFTWVKDRVQTGGYHHILQDAVRGANKVLYSNLTNAEVTASGFSFTSTGFTVGTGIGDINVSSSAEVAWNWNAGGSTVTNTSGSISAQVRASPASGFSIVTYTGNGSNATVGHGIGVAPSMVIVKQRNTTRSWPIYHSALGATKFLDSGVGMINNNGTTFYLKPEDMAAYHEGQKVANALLRNASINDLGSAMDASAAADAANWAKTLAKIGSEAYQQEAIRNMGTITEIPPGAVGDAANAVASLLNSIGPALSSIAGQAAGGSKPSAQKVTEGQLNELFGMTGNKVDASKLKAAWEKAGSPTDSVALGKFLTTQGISSPAVTSVFAQLKLPDPFAVAPVAKPTAATTSQPAAPATTAQPTAATASQPTAQPTTPAPTSAIGQGIAQYKPGQQGVNPELQKRLAARKAGKPQYAANLEENRLRKHKHVIR